MEFFTILAQDSLLYTKKPFKKAGISSKNSAQVFTKEEKYAILIYNCNEHFRRNASFNRRMLSEIA